MHRFALPFSLAVLLLSAPEAFAGTQNTCVFTISMTSGVDINNLDFTVNYQEAGGTIEGSPTHPECARALGGQAFAGFHDNDAARQLSVAIIRLEHFSAPVELAGCRIFYDTVEPIPSDFVINITNAGRDGGDNNVQPKPDIVVSKVECPGDLPSVTTTTLPDITTTTLPGADRCGFPSTDGETPSASDALAALKAAVGARECALCVCDINDNGNVGAGDALGILRAAVGIPTVLDCPAC